MTEERDPSPQLAPRRRRGRILFSAFVWLFVFYAVGFSLFVLNLPRPAEDPGSNADAIVALTGEGGRLAPAVLLLEHGGGKRLLITGVNKSTTKRNLKSLLQDAGTAFDCCADLGLRGGRYQGQRRGSRQVGARAQLPQPDRGHDLVPHAAEPRGIRGADARGQARAVSGAGRRGAIPRRGKRSGGCTTSM